MEKYSKVRAIGEGSFGKAILVKNKENGLQYVVKEISISKMSPKERNEARKEVKVLSKMQHPNIVHYKESFEEKGCLYIVMEYCEGGDLYAKINSQRGMAFSEIKVVNWFVQICLALKHVHDRKILHRDIKTSNIFLTKEGNVKLGDFGIARVLNNTMELARTCIGTPYYLSPEICENKPYNNKSDVWALGCVLYEVLTLKHAFEAVNMKNLVLKIIRGSYPPVPSRYSHDLRQLVEKLFRRNPRDRPSVNSILRFPFIAKHTIKFLPPDKHEEEFSHTVLHGNDLSVPAAKKSAPLARPSSANARNQQLAGIYGKPIAAKQHRPASAASRYRSQNANAHAALVADREKRRQKFIQDERKRREDRQRNLREQKKKHEMELKRRQEERKKMQINKDRDEARKMNLKRSADMLESPENNIKPSAAKPSAQRRPESANVQGRYDKYHEYLNKLRQQNNAQPALNVPPRLDQVKAAWEGRVNAQNAVFNAMQNKELAQDAAKKARVVNEYLSRKQEAENNKKKGKIEIHGEKYKEYFNNDVADVAALPNNPGKVDPKKKEEDAYLARLRQIRIQNFNERRMLKDRMNQDNFQLAKERRKQIEKLQQQIAKPIPKPTPMPANPLPDKKLMEEKARERGIIPPEERFVNYNPDPIGITQALGAIGKPVDEKGDSDSQIKEDIPAAKNDLRKQILNRINKKFVNDKEEGNGEIAVEHKEKILNVLQQEKEEEKAKWNPSNIKMQLEAMPLQETGSQMEATSVEDPLVMKKANDIVAANKWSRPSETVINKLGELSIQAPTLTLPQENEVTQDPMKPNIAANFNQNKPIIAEVQKFTINLKPAISAKPPSLVNKVKQKAPPSESVENTAPSLGIGKQTIVLGEIIAPNSHNTPVIESPKFSSEEPKPSVGKSTFVVPPKDIQKLDKSGEIEDLDQEIEICAVNNTKASKDSTIVKPKPAWDNKDQSNNKQNDLQMEDNSQDLFVVEKESSGELKQSHQKKDDESPTKENSTWAVRKLPISPIKSGSTPITSKTLTKSIGSEDVSSSSLEKSPNSPQKLTSDSTEKLETIEKNDLPTKSKEMADKNASIKNQYGSCEMSPSSKDVDAEESMGTPLFAKNTPSGAVTVVFNQETSKVETPKSMSKTMYTTARNIVAMKLTLGQFDSPNPKLLRTCSLPDLTKAIEEDSSNSENNSISGSIYSSMNDTNFEDLEINEEAGGDLSNIIEDEEDEMRCLRENLENVLLHAGETSEGSSSEDAEDELSSSSSSNFEDVSANRHADDGWESDSDGESVASDCSNGSVHSVFSRIESIRAKLEKELGLKELLKAYRYIQAIHEDEEDNIKDGEKKIKEILGDRHDILYPKILQLVLADGAYCEGNT